MAESQPEVILLSSGDSDNGYNNRDEDELLELDFPAAPDPLGEWPRLAKPPSPPPVQKSKSKIQLKPAKITLPKPSKAKPTSSAAASARCADFQDDDAADDEDEEVISYRVTSKNLIPSSQKEKAARAAEKERQKAEREQRKADQEREKQLKKSENELRKNSKPGEAFKFMIVKLDPNFVHKTAVEEVLDSAEITHWTNDNVVIANSVVFERETVYQAMGEDLQLHKQSRFDEEDQMFLYLEADEIVPKVAAQMGIQPEEGAEEDLDFVTYASSLQSSLPKKQLTFLLFGMESYFKKVKKNEHQEYRQRVLNAGVNGGTSPKKRRKKKETLATITRFDLQSAMIELQLKTGVNYRLLNSVKELGLMLVQYTKAIADAPFKIAQREQSSFDWYALADTTGSVKVDKETGQGLSDLWVEQLQQFSNVGVDSARAIARKYPTPLALMKAYEECMNQDEGMNLLKDINVRTGFGPLQKTRRLGPEASKKLFRFFTSSDPERCLGSTRNS